VHPLLARLYAARGVSSRDELDDGLARLLPPAACWARRRRRAAGRRHCRAASACASWPTTTATAPPPAPWRARPALLGAQHVSYLVPDRVVDGYGLTAPIAQRVKPTAAPTC
jgi:single-stranded-DNA-specific exonuclease